MVPVEIPLVLHYLYLNANHKPVYLMLYNDNEFTLVEHGEVELLKKASKGGRKSLDGFDHNVTARFIDFTFIKNMVLPDYVPKKEPSKVR